MVVRLPWDPIDFSYGSHMDGESTRFVTQKGHLGGEDTLADMGVPQ